MSIVSDLIGGIFGGGSTDVPEVSKLPTDPRKDPAVLGALRKAAKMQRRPNMGRASTILTSPTGVPPATLGT